MTIHDDHRSGDDGVDRPAGVDRSRRRTRAVAGVAGLAALLGAGAYLITTEIVEHNNSAATRDAGALAPVSPQLSPVPSALASSASASTKPAATPSVSPSPSKSMTVEERIQAARAAAAKDGVPVQRPLTPAPGIAAAGGAVNERNETTKTGSLRVVSAKFDLTGQRELLWAADEGKAVGDARCTQKLHFSNNTKPTVRPTVLLCWRTSAARSVVTVLVDYHRKPSARTSLAILDREWAKLR